MSYIRFKHQDETYDLVSTIGLQACLNRGIVKEFYRPSEKRWINPLKDPIRKRPNPSFPAEADRRSN